MGCGGVGCPLPKYPPPWVVSGCGGVPVIPQAGRSVPPRLSGLADSVGLDPPSLIREGKKQAKRKKKKRKFLRCGGARCELGLSWASRHGGRGLRSAGGRGPLRAGAGHRCRDRSVWALLS